MVTWGARVRVSLPAGASRADDRAGPDGCPGAHGHRGHQGGVGADEGPVADDGEVLVGPVVVAGDGPGADVDPAADLRVPDVGQVVDLAALARRWAFLISTKLPTWVASARSASGRRRAKGPTRAPAPTLAPSMTQLAKTWVSGADGAVAQQQLGPMRTPVAQADLALEDAIDVDGARPARSSGGRAGRTGPGRARVTPARIRSLGLAALVPALQGGELHPVVDPGDLLVVSPAGRWRPRHPRPRPGRPRR